MKRFLIVMLSCAIGAGLVGPLAAQPPVAHARRRKAGGTACEHGPRDARAGPIERVQFRGNRKVEDDAIRVQLLSKPGALFDASKMREDIRAMWKMGFFADVNVEAEINASAG